MCIRDSFCDDFLRNFSLLWVNLRTTRQELCQSGEMRRVDLIGREHGRYPHTPKDLRDSLAQVIGVCGRGENGEGEKRARHSHFHVMHPRITATHKMAVLKPVIFSMQPADELSRTLRAYLCCQPIVVPDSIF